MISAKQREMIQKSLHREESKVVTIVLSNETQVAGEIATATNNGVQMTDGRYYTYEQIREINGLYE